VTSLLNCQNATHIMRAEISQVQTVSPTKWRKRGLADLAMKMVQCLGGSNNRADRLCGVGKSS
jgi:hypothetical protein